MGAKGCDVHPSHSGCKNSEKLGQSKGQAFFEGPRSRSALAFFLDGISKATDNTQSKNNMEVAPMTERVRMSFRLKEFPGGQPWICLEPIKEDLIVLANGFLGFDLPAGTTIEKAKKIAEFLEENVATVSYTKLY